MIRAIAAIDNQRGIADDNGIPWQGKIPSDIKYYRDKIRAGGDVLMGFGLYKELSKPYQGGTNFVAVPDESTPVREGFVATTDPVGFLKAAKNDVWDTGGAAIFASTIDLCDELYLTQLQADFKCTKFFPEFQDKFVKISESKPLTENGITFTFQTWRRKN
ncbi:MAG: dihydrofolate reductase [Candidatus Saccharimonadales bacterium]